MSSYKKTTLSMITVPDLPRDGLPFIIDDYALAMYLRVRCKTIWFCISCKPRIYRTFSIPKANGKARMIHNPHPALKFIQKRIDRVLLKPLPLMDCVGAYIPGKSCVDSAKRHVQQGVRVGMDIKDFFPTHTRARVRKFFHEHLGYSLYVSGLLADLCTVQRKIKNRKTGEEFVRHDVPQGSPASPTLCNLLAQEALDHAVIDLLGKEGWVYTRYSDDITLSHADDLSRKDVDDAIKEMRRLMREAGYRDNAKKLKIQRRWRQQRMLGAVINEKVNIPRHTYRKYRSILHNCLLHGFEPNMVLYGWEDGVPSFISHLQGKISYFQSLNEEKAARLRSVLAEAVERHAEKEAADPHYPPAVT